MSRLLRVWWKGMPLQRWCACHQDCPTLLLWWWRTVRRSCPFPHQPYSQGPFFYVVNVAESHQQKSVPDPHTGSYKKLSSEYPTKCFQMRLIARPCRSFLFYQTSDPAGASHGQTKKWRPPGSWKGANGIKTAMDFWLAIVKNAQIQAGVFQGRFWVSMWLQWHIEGGPWTFARLCWNVEFNLKSYMGAENCQQESGYRSQEEDASTHWLILLLSQYQ